ncbi:MAG: 2-phospho-L-lactate guanylyltransferase [Chloroflexi bacterium]|nr:2-phospho-L-lactate guanylyltransferase [Chloroflexota bacterium]
MSLWCIVPVKRLDGSKSRLRGVLSPDQRVELSREMLLHTLQVLSEIPEVERTLVVSADPKVLALAREHEAEALEERGSPELNKALSQATALAQDSNAKAVLVLPADLPLIQAADVRVLIELMQDPPVVVISPDRTRSGTNALLVAPPGTLEYYFGPGSFNRHVRRAEASGARIEIVELPALGLDLDAPKDLEIYQDRVALIKE